MITLIKKLVKRGGRPEAGKTENPTVEILGIPTDIKLSEVTLPDLLGLYGNDIELFAKFVFKYFDKFQLSLIAPETEDTLDEFLTANPNFVKYWFRDKATGNPVNPGDVRITTNKKTGETTETDVYRGLRMSLIKAINGAVTVYGVTEDQAYQALLKHPDYLALVKTLESAE
jgi:hypothetical protein